MTDLLIDEGLYSRMNHAFDRSVFKALSADIRANPPRPTPDINMEAYERMKALVEKMAAPCSQMAYHLAEGDTVFTEARAIAAMLKPPVDPLVLEMREWLKEMGYGISPETVDRGDHDKGYPATSYLAGRRAGGAK